MHYLSGMTIAIFVGVHLFNHICSLAGSAVHIGVMNSLRCVYRNPFIETILLCSIVLQIISGVILLVSRRKYVVTNFDRLHLWTSLYLAVFFIIHVSAVFIGRLFLHLDTNLYFGIAGLNTFPANLFFIPYYGLAIISFFGHIASIHAKKMNHTFFDLTTAQQAVAILTLGIIVTLTILFGLTDHFRGETIPEEYEVLIGNKSTR